MIISFAILFKLGYEHNYFYLLQKGQKLLNLPMVVKVKLAKGALKNMGLRQYIAKNLQYGKQITVQVTSVV